jgi:hypothetical protein
MNRVPIAVEIDPVQCSVIQERIINFVNVILNPSLFVFNEDNSWPSVDEPLGTWFNVGVTNMIKHDAGETGAVTLMRGFPLGPWRTAHDINFTEADKVDCNLGEIQFNPPVRQERAVRGAYEGPRFSFFAQTDMQKEFEQGILPVPVSSYFFVHMYNKCTNVNSCNTQTAAKSVARPVLSFPPSPEVLLPSTSPHSDDPPVVAAGLKRTASTLVAAPSIRLSDGLAKQRALVDALKKTSEGSGLVGMALHEACSATTFAEATLKSMVEGGVGQVGSEEGDAAKRLKPTVIEPATGVKVNRTQNTGGFAGLEQLLGIDSDVALADGKKPSKKGSKDSADEGVEGDEGAEGEGQGGDE